MNYLNVNYGIYSCLSIQAFLGMNEMMWPQGLVNFTQWQWTPIETEATCPFRHLRNAVLYPCSSTPQEKRSLAQGYSC